MSSDKAEGLKAVDSYQSSLHALRYQSNFCEVDVVDSKETRELCLREHPEQVKRGHVRTNIMRSREVHHDS